MTDLINITNLTNLNLTNLQEEPSLVYIISMFSILSLIALTTIVGNFLVIIAVVTTRSLHTITNAFIVSLAVADLLVAMFVLPLSIYMVVFNNWIFGEITCDLWISCDVMLCTASILNLCCISLDRYFAITRPLTYSRQRSPKLAKTMIAVVWIGSVLISCPPVFGWRDKNREKNTCVLNQLLSYRIYSSIGSFFLPCFIMMFVYFRIFKVIHDREKYLKTSNNSNAKTFSFLNKNELKKTKKLKQNSKCVCCFRAKNETFKSNMSKDAPNLNYKSLKMNKLDNEIDNNQANHKTNQKRPLKQQESIKIEEENNKLSIINDENLEDDDELIKSFSTFINESTSTSKINRSESNNSTKLINEVHSNNIDEQLKDQCDLERNDTSLKKYLRRSRKYSKNFTQSESKTDLEQTDKKHNSIKSSTTNSSSLTNTNLLNKHQQKNLNEQNKTSSFIISNSLVDQLNNSNNNVNNNNNSNNNNNDIDNSKYSSISLLKFKFSKKPSHANKITRPNTQVAKKLANSPNLLRSNHKHHNHHQQHNCTKKNHKQISSSSFSSTSGYMINHKLSSFNSKSSNGNQEQMRLLKESKAAKTLAIVVGGFIVSWLPFFIMYVVEAILPKGAISKTTSDSITWLGYVNSAINPFIYAFCSKQFRSAFYRITFGNIGSTSYSSKKNHLYYTSNNNIYLTNKHINQSNCSFLPNNINNNNNNNTNSNNYSVYSYNKLNRKKISTSNIRNI